MSTLNDGIEVHGSKGGAKGRSIHATRRFSPGDVIARFDDPAVVLPPGQRALEYCNHCLRNQAHPAAPKLRACTGCKTVAYCGLACQRANWAAVHKLECKAIKRLHEAKPADQPDWVPTPVRAAAQVMLRPKVLEEFDALEGHVGLWKKDDDMKLKLQAHGVVKCLGADQMTPMGLEAAYKVLCKLQTNAFSRTEEYSESGGIFLDTKLAMMNHSCVPNALVQFGGRSATLRATAVINSGDEIEISYIDHTQPKGKRQGDLDSYHFQCSCPKCQHDLDEYQVAKTDPTVDLNASLSVMRDISRFQNYPSGGAIDPSQRTVVTKLSKIFPVSLRNMEPKEKHEWLRKAYKTGSYFVQAEKWAVEPFAQVVDEACFYFGKDQDNHECALAVACLSAYDVEPFKHVAPWHPQRLKGLSSIAIALSNTAPNPERLVKLARDMAAAKKFPVESVKVLENLDQVSLCQMILSIIHAHSPLAPSADWEVLVLAQEMLKDIESLPGRDRENGLIIAWRKDPKSMDDFFEFSVVEPIKALSKLGKVVLEVDMGLDRDLST
ncbi:mynd finger family protein [Colletotrichum sojae]|uniref:Mynd finger family protein n=1 Tax=Colletotrichum sojae TaxID=2175907 RepID=A0A8H6N2V5_9PEZI|nr:mynd finger family protein [Colletotrichum sojae]